MTSRIEHTPTHSAFFASVGATLSDSRLWLIVLPSLFICVVALLVLKAWMAGAVSFAVALIDAHLINRIESLPRPKGMELARGAYRTYLLPATTGALVFASSDLFVRLWFMPWHWFHKNGDIPGCGTVLTGSALGWLGVPITAAVTAVLVRERAAFATVVGLALTTPLDMTESLSGDNAARALTVLTKSCKLNLDSDPAGYADGFGWGVVTAMAVRVLISIFVARVVSTWLSRTTESPDC